MCGEELHNYLIERVSFQQCRKIKFPHYSTRDINELTGFLNKQDGHILLKSNEQTLFYSQCRFGCILDRIFYLHKEKHQKKEIKETFFVFLSENIHELRSKIENGRKNLVRLAISFNEFYQRKNEIILLLKNPL